MLTVNIERINGKLSSVNGSAVPSHLIGLYIPPAWTEVKVNLLDAPLRAMGKDAAGREQRLYSAEHTAAAKSDKFQRVRGLLSEMDDIRTQIESDINDKERKGKHREAALVAYLIFETGMRPGTGADALAAVQSYGATTLELRHVFPAAKGVRLKFIGKKGVPQNILVTNPYLAELILARKRAGTNCRQNLFNCGTLVNQYIAGLGTGEYTAKDFRTMRGTKLALELLGNRKRLPRTKAGRKKVMNTALDAVAKFLGNTRTVSKGSYVDPVILERFLI